MQSITACVSICLGTYIFIIISVNIDEGPIKKQMKARQLVEEESSTLTTCGILYLKSWPSLAGQFSAPSWVVRSTVLYLIILP